MERESRVACSLDAILPKGGWGEGGHFIELMRGFHPTSTHPRVISLALIVVSRCSFIMKVAEVSSLLEITQHTGSQLASVPLSGN